MNKYISGQREELVAKKIGDAAYNVPIIKRGIKDLSYKPGAFPARGRREVFVAE